MKGIMRKWIWNWTKKGGTEMNDKKIGQIITAIESIVETLEVVGDALGNVKELIDIVGSQQEKINDLEDALREIEEHHKEIKELFQATGNSKEQNEISINGKKYAKHPEAKA